MKIERRMFSGSCRSVKSGEARKIGGIAAVFYDGTPRTEYEMPFAQIRERIMPGAFDSVIDKDDVRALFNHNADAVLGRTPATLRLEISTSGLEYEIDPPDTQVGRDLLVTLDRGDITGSSIGFRVDRNGETWRDDDENDGWSIREISEFAELRDVSPVTYPAYPATESEVRDCFDHMAYENYLAAKKEREVAAELAILKDRYTFASA